MNQVPLIGTGPSPMEKANAEREIREALERGHETLSRLFPTQVQPIVAGTDFMWPGETLHDVTCRSILSALLNTDKYIAGQLRSGSVPADNDKALDAYVKFAFEMTSRYMMFRERYFSILRQTWEQQDAAKKAPSATPEVRPEAQDSNNGNGGVLRDVG